MKTYLYREKPMGVHGLHNWWYACLQGAGIVPDGVTSDERMHKARHTAGQRVLDATGNLKPSRLLGHQSIQATGGIYTDWDVEPLAASLLEAVEDEVIRSFPREHLGNGLDWRKMEAEGSTWTKIHAVAGSSLARAPKMRPDSHLA